MPWPDPSLPPSSPPPSSSSASSPPAPGAPSLRGRRILVAEDDYLLAGDLREMLERHGTQVLGPVPGVADALRLLEREAAPDAAVLDINLGGEMVYPLADALRARGVPFVFATGYDAWAIPDVYAAVPRFEKPVEARHVMQALASR